MIQKNKWVNYIKINEIPDNGIFICQPTDAVLDADSWPMWAIIMREGKVINQENLYTAPGGGYKITNMEGWTKLQFGKWLQYEEFNDPQQQANNTMWLGEEPKSDYWFTIAIGDDHYELLHTLAILSCYKVQMEIIGDGDNAEFILVNGETRDGDLILAEMCFTCDTWNQAMVCPVCKDAGETTCGHMHFDKHLKPAF